MPTLIALLELDDKIQRFRNYLHHCNLYIAVVGVFQGRLSYLTAAVMGDRRCLLSLCWWP